MRTRGSPKTRVQSSRTPSTSSSHQCSNGSTGHDAIIRLIVCWKTVCQAYETAQSRVSPQTDTRLHHLKRFVPSSIVVEVESTPRRGLLSSEGCHSWSRRSSEVSLSCLSEHRFPPKAYDLGGGAFTDMNFGGGYKVPFT